MDILLAIFLLGLTPAVDKGDEVKVSLLLSQEAVRPGDVVKAAVEFDIAKTFHIYDATPQENATTPTIVTIEPAAGLSFSKPTYPKPIEKTYDAPIGKLRLYEGRVLVFFTIKVADNAAPGERELKALVTYGPCTDEACLPPVKEHPVTLKVSILSRGAEVKQLRQELFAAYAADETPADKTPGGTSDKEDDFAAMVAKGLFVALGFSFISGLASCLTPCVYPMMPITVSFFMSQSSESRFRTVLMALIYVLGIAVTYSILGVAAGLSGAAFGKFMGDRVVVSVIAAVLALLGLSMFGLYEFRLPAFLTGGLSSAKRGYAGALVMGLLLGIVAAPCLGPILLGILTYISKTQDPWFGFLSMFVYALGLGVPFFVLAIAPGILPRSGAWMTIIKVVFGDIIFGIALYFLTSVYPLFIVSFISGILLIIFAAYLWHHWRKGEFSSFARWIVAPLLALSLLGGLFFTAGLALEAKTTDLHPVKFIAWAIGSEGKLTDVAIIKKRIAEAKEMGKPVMIDFWANWCIPCKEIDSGLLKRGDIVEELKRFAVVKVDVSENGGETQRFMEREYGFKGVPSLAFHDPGGTMRKDLFLSNEKVIEERLLETLRSIK